MLQLECLPQFEAQLDTDYLEMLANQVLSGEGLAQPVDLSLTITDDRGIRAINRDFRGVDAATDVLSFSLLAASEESFVPPPDGILHLGDIIISLERAAAQASDMGHTTRQEVGELFVHGLLHILGYNHEDEAGAAVMAEKAEEYAA